MSQSLQTQGVVTYNGSSFDTFLPERTAAYINQTDTHLPELTVRETLDFSARCQGIGNKDSKPIDPNLLVTHLPLHTSNALSSHSYEQCIELHIHRCIWYQMQAQRMSGLLSCHHSHWSDCTSLLWKAMPATVDHCWQMWSILCIYATDVTVSACRQHTQVKDSAVCTWLAVLLNIASLQVQMY